MASTPVSSGLLSGLYTYVSRELGSFVSTATGSSSLSSNECADAGPSNLRVKTVKKKRAGRDAKVYSDARNVDRLKKGKRRENRKDFEYESLERQHAVAKHSKEIKCSDPVEQTDEDGRLRLVSMPPPQFIPKRPLVTMPGSLYPRSESMQPESIPSPPGVQDNHYAQFPDIRVTSPTPTPGRQRVHAPATQFSLNSPQLSEIYPKLPKENTSKVDANLSPTSEDVDDFPAYLSLSEDERRNKDVNTERPRRVVLVEMSAKAKGKQRAEGSCQELTSADTSGEIRVRGKERELVVARQSQQDRESNWERNRDSEGDRAKFEAEREKDKERIRLLEDEIQRLKEELAKRRTVEPPSRTERIESFYMPPPPPPPPPLNSWRVIPAPISHPISGSGTFATDEFLSSARASLKHTGTPEEAPINSIYAGSRSKRTGQPTVNIETDKMAAFLSEMKSVKLRKVGSLGNIRAANDSTFAARRYDTSTVESVIRKRKRINETAPDRSFSIAKRRLITTDTLFASKSFTYIPAPPQASAGPSIAPVSGSQPSGPQVQAWPSTSTDLTTPSLCSDNEHEGETATEDRSPATPPAIDQAPPLEKNVPKPKGPQRVLIDVEIDPTLPRPLNPPLKPRILGRQPVRTPPRPQATDIFAKRLPTSPMPLNPTPKRVKKPMRLKVAPVKPAAPLTMDDEEDPLALSYSPFEVDLGPPVPPPPPTRMRKSRGDKSSTSRNGKDNAASKKDGDSSAVTSRSLLRRQTLDEEIRIAEENGSMDSGVFTGIGSKSKKRGFLKGGGAAGTPVFMGVGFVQSAEESGDEGVDESYVEQRPTNTRVGRRR